MNKILSGTALMLSLFLPESEAGQHDLIYWNSPDAFALNQRIEKCADYWRIMPHLALQKTRGFCAIASAVTILNSLDLKRPADSDHAPYHYFTQNNFFSEQVKSFLTPHSAMNSGVNLKQLVNALKAYDLEVEVVPGPEIETAELRSRLKVLLNKQGHYVLVNYLRSKLHQEGGGHWSVLGAYDSLTDRVLILDVAKYKYPPVWVRLTDLSSAIATIDTRTKDPRGLLVVSAGGENDSG